MLCFTCIWGQFSKYKPLGGLYLDGRFNRGFFALPVGGSYIWKGLYMEGLTNVFSEFHGIKFTYTQMLIHRLLLFSLLLLLLLLLSILLLLLLLLFYYYFIIFLFCVKATIYMQFFAMEKWNICIVKVVSLREQVIVRAVNKGW